MPNSSAPFKHHRHTIVEQSRLFSKKDIILLSLLLIVILLVNHFFAMDYIGIISNMTRKYNRLLLNKILVCGVSVSVFLGVYFLRRFKELHNFNQEMAKHAYFDAVTELPNRALVYEQLNKRMQQRHSDESLIIAFIDFDRFKIINDTYGHNFGDQLLQQVAARLAGALQGNEMIARLGGDEFLFVSSIKDISEISDLVVRLKVTRNTPFTIQNISINLKYSIGVAVYPDNGDTVEALIHAADTAMYHAKLQGKTYCVASNTGIEDIIPLQESVKIVS